MGGGGWTKTASAGVAERKRHTDCRGVCLLVLVSVFVGPGVSVCRSWCQVFVVGPGVSVCLLVLVSVFFVGPGVSVCWSRCQFFLVLVSVFVCWSWCARDLDVYRDMGTYWLQAVKTVA